MLDKVTTDTEAAVRGAAEAYCRALHAADTARLPGSSTRFRTSIWRRMAS